MSIRVYDFFSGCGGTSAGLQAAGMQIVLGVDNDPDAAATYQLNFPEAHIINDNIEDVATEDLAYYAAPVPGTRRLFSCCAPCQSFSILNRNRNTTDRRARLLDQFSRFVESHLPEFILLENVPGVQSVNLVEGPFADFKQLIDRLGYFSDYDTVKSQSYGVPQRRKRFVLMASLLGDIRLPEPTHGPGRATPSYSTVWHWIHDLPPIAAGESHPDDPIHRSASLSSLNLKRITATPPGHGRLGWSDDLRLDCHRGDYNGHSDVYGRMRMNEPASGLTTRCISLSNGRFGHPTQDRAISAREAACLQTFPREFIFTGSLNSMARQIGNAVPVLMAQRFGQQIVAHSRTFID